MPAAPPPEPAARSPVPLVPLIRTGHSPRVELPLPLTSFVGREREVAAVCAALQQDGVRFLTLTGPGGVGKTRLALRVAEELVSDFPDGVWFVPLAPVRDPALVPSAIAGALGVREAADRPLVAALRTFLRDKQALLLLDNCEHLLEAALLVTDLLSTCPRLAVLATSRAVLRLSGEHDFVVPPLALPDLEGLPLLDCLNEAPAVRLFVERARAARADFALTAETAAAVVRICHRLDGLPLAIELAAARLSHLSTSEILARLGRRLPLLTGGPQDQPARRRTMRAAIAWSYDLLASDEQALFRRLSVFAGRFTLDAAQTVAGPKAPDSTLDLLSSLIDKSLLGREEGAGGGSRFAVLETMREFGWEQLVASGEEEAACDAHAAYILALAERAEPHLFGPDQTAWLDRLEAELPDVRAALGWLRARGRAEEGLCLAAAPGRFWWRRGYVSEGRGWLAAFLALPEAGGASPVRVRALLLAADLAAWQQENEQALAWDGEAAALARDLGDEVGLAMALKALGCDAIDRGCPERAVLLLEESFARFRDQGERFQAARVQAVQATAALAQGDHARAAAYLEPALAVFRDRQDGRLIADALEGLGLVALARGDEQGARCALVESLALSAELGDKSGIACCLMDLAGVAGLAGQAAQAARLLGASAALRHDLGRRFQPHEQVAHDRIEAAARSALGTARFAAEWERGAALPLADAIAEATAVHPSPSGSPVGLTHRELHVLRLLADGKSDPEIAAALFISRRTAATHVAAVFRKLGVTSRAAAAAYAVRHGLA